MIILLVFIFPKMMKLEVGILMISIVVCLGFSIYSIYSYASRNQYPDTVGACANLDNVTSLTLHKQALAQWHWTYASDDGIESIQRCPTFENDLDIYKDGSLVARTDGKILSTRSRTNIYDCRGNLLYVVQTGNIAVTLLNMNKIFVSLVLYDANMTVIAFVKSSIFVVGDIDFWSINDTVVATATLSLTPLYTWTYTTDGTIDMTPLIAISTKISFADDGKKKDICNGFFIGAVSVAGAALLMAIFMCGHLIRRRCRDDHEPHDSII